jgi:glycerol-3-phosphate acyltransferase PlsY
MFAPLIPFIAYVLGSIPFGYLIVRWQKGIDVRSTGSGSIGATNVMRNLGLIGFVATFLLDFAKGAAAVLLAARWTGNAPVWVAAAAFAAVVGHCFPVWLKFRGGKGVATAAGVFFVLAPIQVGIAVAIFVIVLALGRYVSLGSIIAVGAFPVLFQVQIHPPPALVAGAAACALVIIARHQSNIRRLLKGTENRLGRKSQKGVGSRE